jgi:hypothetical protein
MIFSHNSLIASLTSEVLIVLISPLFVNDYRPISLLGGPIKLITKLLANRV